ncbi:hypothetical protein BO83DRAFT_374257 [Aspergillus eucalypticola CBS 122712]|uniref:Secreted protein n=1 Tax=Aspergillus eucalypticola (strain CBS 122712 / IBT 29274) TaxID=1448314 RepID=A0A317WGD0_ASPEC|nr:uncharacterized protein BO83DRAFT_374257 [Aspergillus eucalypticola CBS 122712]PWY85526.1 hypothetical protein BO83DRAFT_374257 [Aspergillus eucalypticola CBS 122712]
MAKIRLSLGFKFDLLLLVACRPIHHTLHPCEMAVCLLIAEPRSTVRQCTLLCLRMHFKRSERLEEFEISQENQIYISISQR